MFCNILRKTRPYSRPDEGVLPLDAKRSLQGIRWDDKRKAHIFFVFRTANQPFIQIFEIQVWLEGHIPLSTFQTRPEFTIQDNKCYSRSGSFGFIIASQSFNSWSQIPSKVRRHPLLRREAHQHNRVTQIPIQKHTLFVFQMSDQTVALDMKC